MNQTTTVPDISVILPTRNRVASLRNTLASIARQGANGTFTYEVVVVDNGSTDDTARAVKELQRLFPVPLRYVLEPRAGKSAAINAGIEQTHSAWIVIVDDDVIAEPVWLTGLWQCICEQRTDAIGGRVLPLWVDGRPDWMTDKLMGQLGTLGLLDFGPARLSMHPAARQYWWVGSNIALRRTLLERIGGFDERRTRGQDSELYSRCVRVGATIIYEPAATVYHRADRSRLTPAYFRQWHHRAGRYRAYDVIWKPHHLVSVMPLYCYRELLWWAWCWLRSWWRGESRWERLIYECRLRASVSLIGQRLRLWPRWWLAVLTGQSGHTP